MSRVRSSTIYGLLQHGSEVEDETTSEEEELAEGTVGDPAAPQTPQTLPGAVPGQQQHWAAVTIQRHSRGHLCKTSMRRSQLAAVRVQASFRGWRVRRPTARANLATAATNCAECMQLPAGRTCTQCFGRRDLGNQRRLRAATLLTTFGKQSWVDEVVANQAGSQLKEDWEHRLRDHWRSKDFRGRQEAEINRRVEVLVKSPIFAKRSVKELRMLALAMEHMEYKHAEVVFSEGDTPNGVYVLDTGACSIHTAAHGHITDVTERGSVLGELSLFLESPRSASVVASDLTTTRFFRIAGEDVRSIMSEAWGNRAEIEARARLLSHVDYFASLGLAERMLLATGMIEKQYHRSGETIVREGDRGDSMYFLQVGRMYVNVRGVGRVATLQPGEMFGEVALLRDEGQCYRTATVVTASMKTVVFSLHRDVAFRLVTIKQAEAMLKQGQTLYDIRAALRSSGQAAAHVNQFWDVLRRHTRALEQTQHDAQKCDPQSTRLDSTVRRWKIVRAADLGKGARGTISRQAYEDFHLRLFRVLTKEEDFDMKKAAAMASDDWFIDIAYAANNAAISPWMEKAKMKLLEALGTKVNAVGWSTLLAHYDTDGSGSLEYSEFKAAVREDMGIPTKLVLESQQSLPKYLRKPNLGQVPIENRELEQIFREADTSGDGSLSAREMTTYLVRDPAEDELLPHLTKKQRLSHRQAKAALQEASRKQVDALGWRELFSVFDSDGSGELDLGEFENVIRKHGKISDKIVSSQNLAALFAAVDADESGTVEADELLQFLTHRPFDQGECCMPSILRIVICDLAVLFLTQRAALLCGLNRYAVQDIC